nr:hypothetical protein [Candidatus Sigynarchaeota archaeon]
MVTKEKGLITDRVQIKDIRCFFIGDRVVVSQAALLCLTGMLSLAIESLPTAASLIWMNVLLVVSCISVVVIPIILFIFGLDLSFEIHWIAIFGLIAAVWLPGTTYLGALLDGVFSHKGNCILVSLFVAFDYVVGYLIARGFRAARYRKSKEQWRPVVVLVLLGILGGCIVAGMVLNVVHLIVAGVGIVLSALFGYYMLHAMFDEVGIDVIEDPPNRLYLICLRNSVIMTFIFWFIIELFFPFLAGGGGGKKRSGSGGSSRSHSSSGYHHTRYWYHRRQAAGVPSLFLNGMFNPARIDLEWTRYGL